MMLALAAIPDRANRSPLPTSSQLSRQKRHLGRQRLLPRKELPATLEGSVDHLLYTVERHRLLFLFCASAHRVNPLQPNTAATGMCETISESAVAGWADLVKDIDDEGTFLFSSSRCVGTLCASRYWPIRLREGV